MESIAESGAAWYDQAPETLFATLGSSLRGLTSIEAENRLRQYGPNLLTEARTVRPFAILLAQFRNLIVWILIGAGVVSGLLGETIDAVAIFAIVLLNAIIGFYQEYSAEKSIAALKRLTAPRAKVWRDGVPVVLAAAKVVPGDLLDLEGGDLVAADARLLEAASLQCVESALTGESEAVKKRAVTLDQGNIPLGDRENMVFMGTSVAGGNGRAVVVATAMETEIGKIARLISEAEDEGTPLQQKLQAFGRVLVWASLAIVGVLFLLGLLRGTDFFEMFMTAVSLAVAAVPEGLPAVVTIALALGVLRMSRRRALVRRLPSVETLGSTNVICTDKTGTLTVGEMTVRQFYVAGKRFEVTGEGYEPTGQVLFEGKPPNPNQVASLSELTNVLIGCNDARLLFEDGSWKVIGDPTEGAMLSAGRKAGGDREKLERDMPRHVELPFDSDRKRKSVVRFLPGGRLRALVNGAPDLLLGRCTQILTENGVRSMTSADREELLEQNNDLAAQSLRVLGSAYRDFDQVPSVTLTAEAVERDLIFVGLTGMYDPPRAEVKDAVKKCKLAGVRVVMITGDHPRTAMAIARELGIADSADGELTGIELDELTNEQLRQRVGRVGVFARVTAEHKLQIVQALKANGAVVAMTGDGVNDAPAIKGADIGIAMGRTGTEVTKQASDMIITDDNFASIVAAVEEGRGIYDNIRKTLQYLLGGNAGELILMTVCVVIGLPAPLLPIHLLWINLVTDGLPAICLATDPIERDVMNRPPRPRAELITNRAFVRNVWFAGLLDGGVSFTVFAIALRTEDLELARTHAFAALVFSELLRSFGARSDTRPVWRMNPFSNSKLLLVVALSFAIQLWSQHDAMLARFLQTTLLPFRDGLFLLALGTVPLLVLEVRKFVLSRTKNGRSIV